MNFKRPKHEVASDASWRAMYAIQEQLNQINNGNIVNVGSTVTNAIRMGIEQALLSMMDDIYTDAEFEEDMGLKDKT